MAYLVYGDIEKFLNITLTAGGQTLVNELIPAIEEFTEHYTGRKWSVGSSTDITEKYDGGKTIYVVKTPPIASVTSVKVGKTASYAGDLLSASEDDYYVYDTYIRLDSSAPNFPLSVEIVYRTSANTLPKDLKHALVRWISEIFKSQDHAGKSVSRISYGSISMDFLTQDAIPKFVEMVLNRYRLNPGF